MNFERRLSVILSVVTLILASLVLSPLFSQADCVGWRCAFEATGPARPPAPEDVFNPDFDMIFGPEPRPTGGVRWTMQDKAAIVQWSQARRSFKGISEQPLNPENEATVMAESGGVPIVWEDVKGNLYVAVLGGPALITSYPFATFNAIPAPSAGGSVVYSMLRKGGCFDPLPQRFGPVAQGINADNCK
jgi:hypothetical protein